MPRIKFAKDHWKVSNSAMQMDSLQGEVKRIALGLKEVLECPVCFGTMDSNLKQCLNGHGVCSSCAVKNEKCPVCKQLLVLRQNTLLGKILECLPKPCPFSDWGCNAVVYDENHQTYCKYRPAECKFCNWKGCVKGLIHHVRECVHKSILCEFSMLNVEKCRWYVFPQKQSKEFWLPIIYQNRLFWHCLQRNHITKTIYQKCYAVKTSSDDCDYYVSLSFKKGDLKFKHCCKALSETDHHGRHHAGSSGLVISDSDMEHFLQDGSYSRYNCTLKLMKEDDSIPYAP